LNRILHILYFLMMTLHARLIPNYRIINAPCTGFNTSCTAIASWDGLSEALDAMLFEQRHPRIPGWA